MKDVRDEQTINKTIKSRS